MSCVCVVSGQFALSGELQNCQLNRYMLRALCCALQNTCPAKSKIELKVGCQVILMKNLRVAQGLCNGSRGVVVKFKPHSRHPVVRFVSGEEVTIAPETFSLSVNLFLFVVCIVLAWFHQNELRPVLPLTSVFRWCDIPAVGLLWVRCGHVCDCRWVVTCKPLENRYHWT